MEETKKLELNKVYCMDALEFLSKIKDGVVNMVLCDLPYGTTSCKWDKVLPLDELWKQYKRILKEDGVVVLTASQPFTTDLINSNRDWFRYSLVWDKIRCAGFLNANRMPLKQYEDIIVFYKKQPTYNPIKFTGKPYDKTKYNNRTQDKNVLGKYVSKSSKNPGERFPKSILRFSQNWKRQNQLHPTQKPVSLFRYLIKTYTNEGELVLDNCIGSGTTAVACKHTNRNFIGCDINQEYVDIANKRLAQKTMFDLMQPPAVKQKGGECDSSQS